MSTLTFLDGGDRNKVLLSGVETYTHHEPFAGFEIGKHPTTNPPTLVIQDNALMAAFTIPNDDAFLIFYNPDDWVPGSDLTIEAHWTSGNINEVSDNTTTVKWQIDYQVVALGGSIAGSHANSPRFQEVDYDSNTAWLDQIVAVTIPNADLVGFHYVLMKISFQTPGATPLSDDPHLIVIDKEYTA